MKYSQKISLAFSGLAILLIAGVLIAYAHGGDPDLIHGCPPTARDKMM